MPNSLFAQIVLICVGLTAIITCLGLLWAKILRPLSTFLHLAADLKPLLEELLDVFEDAPSAFSVLKEIQAQFRTNGGSSLFDIITRLDESQATSAEKIIKLISSVEATRYSIAADRQGSIRDREELRELLLKADRLAIKLEEVTIKVEEINQLAIASHVAATTVATELAAAQKRAVNVSSDEPGAAADVAVLPDAAVLPDKTSETT